MNRLVNGGIEQPLNMAQCGRADSSAVHLHLKEEGHSFAHTLQRTCSVWTGGTKHQEVRTEEALGHKKWATLKHFFTLFFCVVIWV